RFLVLPMFLFSGTFFPISQLPGPLEVVAWITPLWHAVVVCRAATLGTLPDGGVLALAGHVLVLAAFVAAGAAIGMRTFRRRLVACPRQPRCRVACRHDRPGPACSRVPRCRPRCAWSSATSSRGAASGSC